MSVFQTAGWTKEAIYRRILSSQRYCDFLTVDDWSIQREMNEVQNI